MKATTYIFIFSLLLHCHLNAQEEPLSQNAEVENYKRIYESSELVTSNPSEALEQFKELEPLYGSFSDTLKIFFLIEREFCNYRLGNFNASFSGLTEALKLSEANNQYKLNDIHLQFGHLFISVDSLQLAGKHFALSVESALQRGDSLGLLPANDGLAHYYFATDKLDSSLTYFKNNLDLAIALGDSSNIAGIGANYAYALYMSGDVERAIEYQEQAYEIEMSQGDSIGLIFSNANLGQYYYHTNKELAERYQQKAFELAERLNATDNLRTLNEDFSQIEAERGNYKRALEYFMAYHDISNDQRNDEMMDRMKGWEITLDNQQKDAEINLLQSINAYEARQKRMLWMGLGALAVFLAIMVWLVLQLQRNKKQLSHQNEQLADLNATKDKFFSIIAHDLRSPMIALQGVGQKLDYFIRRGKHEKLLEIGGKIDQSIDQLNHLLNNLLNWAASQSEGIPYHPQTTDLKKLIDENIALYKSLAESKNVMLTNQSGNEEIYVDVNTASTVLRNVLSNALKFSPEGGKVTFESHLTDTEVVLSITDQGKGITGEQLAQLFEPNQQSHLGTRGEKGFGLGLKLCYEFMHLNRGKIEVESSPNNGTAVHLTFPTKHAAVVRSIKVALL